MQDSTLLVLILIVVSVGVIIQGVALAGAIVAARKMQEQIRRAELELLELRPRLERMGQAVDRLAELTQSAADTIPRVTRDVENAVEQVKNVARVGAMIFAKPLRPLGAAMALWKGLKNGASVYRSLRPAKVPVETPYTVIP